MRNLFRTKSLDVLVAETEQPEQQLKRTLGPVQLTFLGIGAIIGAGIFSTIGTAAAGGSEHIGAGPALAVSFILVAVACGFAALCYAEFASMVPVSGSAYTYAYATLGELIAWIIGWDLILEYAVGNVAVAISWSDYFQSLLLGFVFHGRRGWEWIIDRRCKRSIVWQRHKRPISIWRRWMSRFVTLPKRGQRLRECWESRSCSTCQQSSLSRSSPGCS